MTSTTRTDSTVVVDIIDVVRYGTSTNGNPTYDIITTNGTYRTMSDASCGYSAGNYRPRWQDREAGRTTVAAVLTLTPAGRVRYLTRPDGTEA